MSKIPKVVMVSNDSRLRGRIIGNSIWNFSAYAAYMVITFISARLYIDYLGLKQYGLLVLLSSIVAPLGLLNFGLGQATVKYMAESIGKGDFDAARRYLSNTLLFNIAIGLMGSVSLALLARWLASHAFRIDPSDQEITIRMLYWTAGTWMVTQVSATFAAVPTALQRFRTVSQANTLFMTLNTVVGLGALAVGGDIVKVVEVRFYWALVTLFGWIWIAVKGWPAIQIVPRYDRAAFRNSFRFGVWQSAANTGGIVANQADKYLLGIYVSTGAVGLFNVPTVIFTSIYVGVTKLVEVLVPAVSDLQGAGERTRLVRMVLIAAWGFSAVMNAVQSAVFVMAPDILHLYLGGSVAPEAVQVLRISAIVAMVSAPSVVIGQYLLGVGSTHWSAVIAFASGSVNLLGGIILIPRYGLAGAAWSDMAAIICTRPLLHFFIWRKEFRGEVGCGDFFSLLYGACLPGVPIALALALIRARWETHTGWIETPLAMLVVAFLVGLGCAWGGRHLLRSPRAREITSSAMGPISTWATRCLGQFSRSFSKNS